MTPATVLSDSETEATSNNNNNSHMHCKSKTENKGKGKICSCGKGTRMTGELIELPTKKAENKLIENSVNQCTKIQIQTTEHICSKPLSKTTKSDGILTTPYQQLICKTYQGHVVERTSCGKHLYCRTHSLFTNCVLNPCSSDGPSNSRDDVFRTPRHSKLSLKKFSRKQIFVLLSLAVGDFISSCSMSIMAPFFPKEATEKGMPVAVSGFVFSFYALVMFIMSPIVGKILPTFGAKPLFIFGLFLAGFSNLLFGFLPAIENYNYFCCACFVIRGMEAIGAGAFSTASFVFVVEVFPENISTVLGVLETFIGLGMSVGPAIGGILYAIGGFSLPFFALGFSMIIVVPVNFFFLPSISSKNKGHSGSFWKILKIPSVFVVGLIIVMSSNIWSFLDPTLEPHLRQLNLSSKEVGLVFLLFSAIYGMFSLIWGWLADRVGNHWSMMVIGQFCSVICLLALGPSPILTNTPNLLWQNLVALSLLGISVALTLMPTFQALLHSAVLHGHERELSTYSIIAGAWSCMYSLGEVLGPTVGAILLDKYDFPICSTVMAAGTLMIAIGSLIFFTLQSTYASLRESNSEKKPLIRNKDKRAYYTDLAGDSCVVFVPTARSP